MKAPSPSSPQPARRPSPPPAPRARPARARGQESPAPVIEARQPDPPPPVAPQVPIAPPPPPPAPSAGSVTSLLSQLNDVLNARGQLPLESAADDSGGSYFVRLISPMNIVRAIPVGAVCNRLCNGWRFIEGEPVIPRARCPIDRHDICDGEGKPGFFPRGRGLSDAPRTQQDAIRVWLEQFVQDAQVFPDRPELDYQYVRRLVSHLRPPSA